MCKARLVTHTAAARRQGKASFGDAGVFVEKYVQRARHIEVQIFGDGAGAIVTLPERECSVQRRHQKVVEETPSPYVRERAPRRPPVAPAGGVNRCAAVRTLMEYVTVDVSRRRPNR